MQELCTVRGLVQPGIGPRSNGLVTVRPAIRHLPSWRRHTVVMRKIAQGQFGLDPIQPGDEITIVAHDDDS